MNDLFEDSAESYDDDIYPLNELAYVEPVVQAIERIATGTKMIEFGVGTGRIALPLAKRGFEVIGVDNAPSMLAQLTKKDSKGAIKQALGDMTTVQLNQKVDTVYLVFNGISYLLTQEAQLDVFQNAARHLKAGGQFIVETFLPRVYQMTSEQASAYELSESYVGFDLYDFSKQLVTSVQVDLESSPPQQMRTVHRYVWPSELHLMGKMADFELVHEWRDWEGNPLQNDSDQIIQVWRKKGTMINE